MRLNENEPDTIVHVYSWQLGVFLPPIAAILALRYSDINCIFKDFLEIIRCRRVRKVFNEQSLRVPLWWTKRSGQLVLIVGRKTQRQSPQSNNVTVIEDRTGRHENAPAPKT